ncbi:Gfo/Idh/MocA family oxidoreductase [Candidatus Peregrinibacteria bacterium]|nr:Gfo/Idh/MocA family oxidoreductase [Candidatus Peregrinibacteria bacterium]
MKKFLHFGIIGCGKIFDRHAESLIKIPEAKLVAASDINGERLKEIEKQYSIPHTYKNYIDLIESKEIDVVVICAPSGLHSLLSLSALKAGKHVLCEKPMALNVADAKKMNDVAREQKRSLFEVKQNRYSPAIRELKSAIDKGLLGKILMGNITVRWNRPQDYYDSNDWYGTMSMDGGVVLNQAIHHIDLLQWMLGKPVSVVAKTAILNHAIEAPDTALAILQFENNIFGNMEITTCAALKNIEGSITILGDKGTVKVGGNNLNVFDIWEVSGLQKPELEDSKKYLTNHCQLYQDIVKFLLHKKNIASLITGSEGLKSLLIAESIFLSSKTRTEIFIDYDAANIR